MSEELVVAGVEDALQALARADRLLDRLTELSEGEGDDAAVLPWQAAHACIARAMCLMIDSLEGVEEVSFSESEPVPVARTREPYSYLSARYEILSVRCRRLAGEHEAGI
ncbi:MAG: hypothetical protein OXP07_00500 [Defluviicoccus sp.]|nr:hypothetical protein [Defluviicoccus sp.]